MPQKRTNRINKEFTQAFIEVAERAARQAGKLILANSENPVATEKRPGDVVTQTDLDSQSLIFSIIQAKFPDHLCMGEEAEAQFTNFRSGYCWIVDPIDGTKNFIHRLPGYSVSIALFLDGRPLVGVVFDPLLNECFSAIEGEGAFLNRAPIRPSNTTRLDKSLLVSSFPSRVTLETPELKRFINVVQHASLRRLGSAALNLCYVASGRLDGYWASTLSLWDLAAGMLIAEEAGAFAQTLSGSKFEYQTTEFSLTATPELGEALLPLLQIS